MAGMLPIPPPTTRPIDPATHLWTPLWYQWLLSLARESGPFSFLTHYQGQASNVMADPGAGNLRWNNATHALSTQMAFSARDAATPPSDISPMWEKVQPGDRLYMQDNVNAAIFQHWTVTSIVDNGTWFLVTVQPVASAGSLVGLTDLFIFRG
jgi:hypothetical protein